MYGTPLYCTLKFFLLNVFMILLNAFIAVHTIQLCVLFQNSNSPAKYSDENSHSYIVKFYDGDESIAPAYHMLWLKKFHTTLAS